MKDLSIYKMNNAIGGILRFMSEYYDSPGDSTCGCFLFKHDGYTYNIIASSGAGWEHVSISSNTDKPPSWEVMCSVKDAFFESEEWVMQFHPARSEYVNNHPYCLHLWRPVDGRFPTPPSLLVGIK